MTSSFSKLFRSARRGLIVFVMVAGASQATGQALSSSESMYAIGPSHEPTSNPTDPPKTSNADEISEKLANPVANLISFPIQYNYDANTGVEEDGDRLTINVQPVIPIDLGKDWLLITRTILPIIYQDDVVPDGGNSQFGLGDALAALYFSPKNSGVPHVTFGFGPEILVPTGTNDSLGSEKWAVGPAFIGLYQRTPWTIGALGYHIWSFAGDGDREYVSQSYVQPFVSYGFGHGWQGVMQLEASYDWHDSDWTIPFSAGASKVVQFGKLPVSFGLQGRYWLARPDGAPEYGVRFVTTFVFPE